MSPKVVPIREQPSLRDMAAWLRKLADDLEHDEVNDIRTLVMLHVELDGGVYHRTFGDKPSRDELVGLFTTAAWQVVAGK